MTIGIYGIFYEKTCLYIGQSSNIEQRWLEHKKRLRSGRALPEFQRWFDSIGRDMSQLKFGILQRCEDDPTKKDELEIMWFNGFKPLFYGRVPDYNQGGGMTERVRLQISSSLLEVNESKTFIGVNLRNARPFSSSKSSESKAALSAREVPRHTLICTSCGVEFKHRLHFVKFCSYACRTKNSKKLAPALKSMYAKGYSLRQVGKMYNLSYITVRNRLIDMGVELRPSHPSNRINE